MSEALDEKLKGLPATPGVYFHKSGSGEIIYIGKAANLRSRVRQYFQKSRLSDAKTDALVAEIIDTDWTGVETELDAVFLEAEMIRRYMPRYNILLRDDKSFVYVRIDFKSTHPTVTFTRRPLDDKAEYFGPYLSKFIINRALKHLRKVFPYSTHAPTNIPRRACLQAQLGLCPGLEDDITSLDEYRKNLKQLSRYVTGKRKKIISEFEAAMKRAAKNHDYEAAAKLRNKIYALKNLDSQIIFGDRENMDISKDLGLVELAEILKLEKPPRRVEGFDISHMSGTDTTASMVVFVAGVPDKSQYRKFKSKVKGNDDFAHMREAMARRFSEKNIKAWGKPDLILIDGGKGQVSAALEILNALNINIPLIGLAKRYEEIIIPYYQFATKSQIVRSVYEKVLDTSKTEGGNATKSQIVLDQAQGVESPPRLEFKVVRLEQSSDALKLLQRIRDESHRFAVSYHSTLKRNRQTVSVLDGVPGVGEATKKKLLRQFGSSRGVASASMEELEKFVGSKKARLIKSFMQ
ncbi:excinuclease ABC subunit UvrC [Candidatus Parcubacteria bacterium]|nr:excinuclease ABC subunit UvrC [Candidatus Parcubacteria bacterium]